MTFAIPSPPQWILETRARFAQLFQDQPSYMFECGEGWKVIVNNLCEGLEALARPQLKIVQIKEKFGNLRVYVEGGDEAAYALIREAETCSSTVCEGCGAPGTKFGDGWILTLCPECQEKRKQGTAF